MKLPTIAVRKEMLEAWLRLSDCTKAELARDLGVTKGRVSQLLRVHTEPSAHLMAKLMVLTQLPFDRLFVLKQAAGAARPVRSSRRVSRAFSQPAIGRQGAEMFLA